MDTYGEKWTGEQSLDIIQSMIKTARNEFGENGHLYLVWGYVVLICSVSEFVLLHFFSFEHHSLVWLLTWVALIYQVIYLSKNAKKRRVKTYTGDTINQIWLVFAVLMIMICIILGFKLKGESVQLYAPVILCLYGMPTFLTGRILQFTPLITGGIACWVLSVLSLFLTNDFQILLFGVAVIIAWIIPGYLLKKKHNSIADE